MRKTIQLAAILALTLSSGDTFARVAQTQKETGAITGHVKVDGKAAPSITILATPTASDPAKTIEQMFSPSASYKATTDADGLYRIEGLPAGKYRVAPSSPTMVSADTNSSSEIVVGEGSTSEGIDFALSAGGVVTGKITDADGRPVIGERISLKPLDTSGGTSASPLAGSIGDRMYATDDRGIYRIYGLRPGRYLVSTGKDSDLMSSFFSQRPKRVQTFYPGVTDEARAKVVQVTVGAEAAGIDIQFSGTDKGFTISGRVVDSEKNTPIPNAMVAYSKVRKLTAGKDSPATVPDPADDSDVPGMPGAFTTTNDKGEFKFTSLTAGSYKLEAASLGGFVAASGGSQFYADPVNFEVTSSNIEKLEIKVHRGIAVNGVVVVEGGDPQDSLDRYGQLMLMAAVTDSNSKTLSTGNCIVGADGSFHLGGLKSGKVTLRPFSIGAKRLSVLRIERNGVDVQSGFDIQVDEDVNGLRVVLTPAAGVVRGRVVFVGGPPPSGARIVARAHLQTMDSSPNEDFDFYGNQTATVDPNGNFSLEGLAPGTYVIEAFLTVTDKTGPKMFAAKQTVTVTNERSAQAELTIDLRPKDPDK